MSETVLCISAQEAAGLRGPLVTNEGVIAKFLDDISRPESFYFFPRDEVEDDPQWLQLIPYAVVCRGREVFAYRRKGGDGRLQGKLSIGLGGHVNLEDGHGLDAVEAALWRELAEELSTDRAPTNGGLVGLIYDTSNPVGRVHLGLVYRMVLSANAAAGLRDGSLKEGRFWPAVELSSLRGEMESWSQLLVGTIV